MSDKFSNLVSELKKEHLLSLYKDRLVVYQEGNGELTYWQLLEDDTSMLIKNSGMSIRFDDYEIIRVNDKITHLHIFFNGNPCFTDIKFPSEKRLMSAHNTLYVEKFALDMEDVLASNSNKGDWIYKTQLKEMCDGIRNNLNKIKANAEAELNKKSAIDIANYAMMLYYLYGEK